MLIGIKAFHHADQKGDGKLELSISQTSTKKRDRTFAFFEQASKIPMFEHNAEVKELINEMAIAASSETGLKFPSDLADKLCAYARSVAHFPTALKEFEWRNGWFVDISLKAISELKKDPLPKHTEIMMAQKLFYKARKVLVKKLKEEGEAAEERWGIQRELKEIEEEDKKSPLNPPTSPTVLLNSKQ